MDIPFNSPHITGYELKYIQQAFVNNQLSGDGPFTSQISSELESIFSSKKALLTHSCTAALEMAALLLDVKPGDEVIMPSYTFVSTANAFALRGATIVFVDIDPLTQNLDLSQVEHAINSKTKAIVVVHYAGISCDMDRLKELVIAYKLPLIEDAAQAIYSEYKQRPLGSFGDMSTVSFHETKNITCGEGGCLLINNDNYIERAEIIREKGTNRSKFSRKEVNKYSWVDLGSSYLPGEVSAAFLLAQLQNGRQITEKRLGVWNQYYSSLASSLKYSGRSPMYVPSYSLHNAHMFYFICLNQHDRTRFIDYMAKKSIGCVFHYVPLHTSEAGLKFGTFSKELEVTNKAASCLIRLPVYPNVDADKVVHSVLEYICD